jgi:hypothetical protein
MDTSPTISGSPFSSAETPEVPTDPTAGAILKALGIALILVLLTRLPVARHGPIESDEFGFLEQVRAHWFPMHHTLFLTLGKCLGLLVEDAYRGFIILDMIMSAVALVAAWWWLRALVSPATAAAGAAVLGCAPVFWGYGAMAGNYTAIVAAGSFLLGVAYRTWRQPAAWHPFAAAVALALGTGHRQDLGTFWLPVLVVILWHHRWKRLILAGGLFTAINLAWLLAMLNDVGGWTRYRAASAEFAHSAGYLNSVWNLGFVDAPVRYGAKLGMALLWTLGPCLIFVPRGISRIVRWADGRYLALLLALSALPAVGSHLLVHFGVPGYAFHYVPALLALVVLGIGAATPDGSSLERPRLVSFLRQPPGRLAAMAVFLASVFLFYPTDYDRPGWRGSFDLSFARHTRIGLRTPMPDRQPSNWRTANSRFVAGAGVDIRKKTSRAL